MLKIPSFADALPLTLGEKLPAPNSIKPSEEWDLLRHDSRGALWKNCAGGRLQFIPNPNSLGPRKGPGKIPPPLQQALDSMGEALKPKSKFKVGDLARYLAQDLYHQFGVRAVTKIDGDKIYFNSVHSWGRASALYPCDADGWIPHTPGDPMPCDGDLKVTCMTRGKDGKAFLFEGSFPARRWDWKARKSGHLEILSWKPVL